MEAVFLMLACICLVRKSVERHMYNSGDTACPYRDLRQAGYEVATSRILLSDVALQSSSYGEP